MRTARFLIALAVAALLGSHAQAQQSVRVGVSTIGAPFGFHDEMTGTDRGLMVDLINEVAKTAGLDLRFQSVAFSSLLPSLTTSKIDLIVGTLVVSDERKSDIAFSAKVYTDSDALVVPQSDATNYAGYDDLQGKILGLQNGVVSLKSLRTDLYRRIRIYDGAPDLLRAMAAGSIEVGVANRSIVGYLLKTGAFPTLRLVPSFKPTNFGDIAFGVRKNDARLKMAVDGALAKLQADGTVSAILGKWGVQ